MQKKVLKVNPKDNIIVALTDLPAGDIVHLDGADYTVLKDTKAKHKFAAEDFAMGDHIIMYGVIVGKANQPIQKGEVITTENVKHESEEVSKKTGDLVGRRQMWINGKIRPSTATIVLTDKLEPKMSGYSSLWCFVKTKISRS
jgi:hypothetical protein